MRAASRPGRASFLRAAAGAAVALAGMVAASLGDIRGRDASDVDKFLAATGAAFLLIGGAAAVRALTTGIRRSMEAQSSARAASVGLVIQAAGYVVVILSVLQVLDVPIGGLLLGGALTGVILGLAAQQVLANFFAGIVLAIVHPYRVGQQVVLRSGPLGGEYEGQVTDMGLFYVELMTESGQVSLPNAGVLAAAVGPGARSASKEPEAEEDAPRAEGGAGRL